MFPLYRLAAAAACLLPLTTFAQAPARFAAPVGYTFNAQSIRALTQDLNRDGRPDVVIAGGSRNAAVVLLSQATGLGNPLYYPTQGFCGGVGLGSFNCDGFADLWISDFTQGSVIVRPGTSTGVFGAVAVEMLQYGNPQHVATGDLNRDGRTDFATIDKLTGILSVGLSSGIDCTADYANPARYNTEAGPLSADFTRLTDLDRDGKLDAVVVNQASPNQRGLSVLLGSGTGQFNAPTSYATGPGFPVDLQLRDLNGDLLPEAVVANAEDANLTVLPGTAAGTFGARVAYSLPAPAVAITVADYNKDTHLDVAALLQNGSVVVLYGTAAGRLSTAAVVATLPAAPDSQSQLLAADFDADLATDLAAVTNGQVHIMRNLGTATNTATRGASTTRLQLYPNPNAGNFRLEGFTAQSSLRVLDAAGRSVAAVVRPGGQIVLAQAAAGLYIVEWSTAGTVQRATFSILN